MNRALASIPVAALVAAVTLWPATPPAARADLRPTVSSKVEFAETRVEVPEGATRSLTVQRGGGASAAGVVLVSSTPGSATQGTDYTSVSVPVEFAPGETEKTVQLDALTDTVSEPAEDYAVFFAESRGDAEVGIRSRVDVTIPGSSGPGGGAPGSNGAPGGGSFRKARCAGRRATIVGTGRRDRIRGTRRRDVIAGLGGNDVIRGLGGNDLVCGGRGKDVIRGGAGRDTLRGDAGADRLHGDSGRDRLLGGAGRDRCLGGPGRDLARCERKRSA